MIIAITGYAAGFLHVLMGPDHLAAIAPLSIHEKESTWKIGFRWGLGHTAGVGLIGILAVFLREVLPIDYISHYSERLVGIVLISIGIWGLRKVLSKQIHTHEHRHGTKKHFHFHLHKPNADHDTHIAHNHSHAALGVGIIHGLAGSSHLLGILPALALPTRTEAFIYIITFGIGTITAMAVFSSLMGSIANKLANRGIQFYKGLLISFSVAAIGIGGFWFFN